MTEENSTNNNMASEPSTKQVRVSLHSQIINLTAADFEEEMLNSMLENALPKLSDEEREAMTEEIDYITDGICVSSENHVEIAYEESETMGLAGVKTSLVWYKSSPDVVTMVRTGNMTAGFVFSGIEPRQICTYETSVMPLEFCICTRRIDNNIDPDELNGKLFVDYSIEFRGMKTERNLLTVEISKRTSEKNCIPEIILSERQAIKDAENEAEKLREAK